LKQSPQLFSKRWIVDHVLEAIGQFERMVVRQVVVIEILQEIRDTFFQVSIVSEQFDGFLSIPLS
jgi:hypothetical protein